MRVATNDGDVTVRVGSDGHYVFESDDGATLFRVSSAMFPRITEAQARKLCNIYITAFHQGEYHGAAEAKRAMRTALGIS